VSVVEERRRADRVVDLSTEGARLETDQPLPSGTTAHFYFIVPGDDSRIVCIDVTATVAWTNEHAMGLHFQRHPVPIVHYLTRLASQLSMR
jgi:hypothetical protein